MVCKSLSDHQKIDKPKRKHRKGLWSPDEDQRLRNYVLKHGHGCWSSVPVNAGLQRNGKSCRLRWINYLRPGLKRGMFTEEEEDMILNLHRSLGNKWSQIAQQLPGRTDNEVKNFWHSYLKKKVAKTEKAPSPSQMTESESQEYSPVSIDSSGNRIPANDLIQQAQNSLPDLQAGNRSSLPKIIFAEWLLDENNAQGMTNVGDQCDMIGSGSTNVFDNYHLNSGDFVFDNILLSDGTIIYTNQNSGVASDASSSEIYYSHFDVCSGITPDGNLLFM